MVFCGWHRAGAFCARSGLDTPLAYHVRPQVFRRRALPRAANLKYARQPEVTKNQHAHPTTSITPNQLAAAYGVSGSSPARLSDTSRGPADAPSRPRRRSPHPRSAVPGSASDRSECRAGTAAAVRARTFCASKTHDDRKWKPSAARSGGAGQLHDDGVRPAVVEEPSPSAWPPR